MTNPFKNTSGLDYIEYLIGSESTNIRVPDEYTGVYCPHCNSCLKNIDELNNHIDLEHSKKRINCPHCEESYKYPNELGRHLKKIHPYETKDTSSKFSIRLEPDPSLNQPKKRKQKSNNKIKKISLVKPLCFGNYVNHNSCKHCMVENECNKKFEAKK